METSRNSKLAFEGGRPVRTVEFDYGDKEPEAHEARLQQETVERLLDFLVKNSARPENIGSRVLTLSYLLGRPAPGCKNQKDLAAKLGVSKARVSTAIKTLRKEIARISRGF